MELPVGLQLAQLGWSVLLGAALCLFYDLLCAQRRLCPALTHLSDALFVLVLTLSLFGCTLYIGQGVLRVFMLVGMAGGAIICRKTLGRLLFPLWTALFRGLFRLFRGIRRLRAISFRFFCAFCKKTVAFVKKSRIIKNRAISQSNRRKETSP